MAHCDLPFSNDMNLIKRTHNTFTGSSLQCRPIIQDVLFISLCKKVNEDPLNLHTVQGYGYLKRPKLHNMHTQIKIVFDRNIQINDQELSV
jgi:hypothetical protein